MATDTLVNISLGKEKQAAMDRFLAKGFPTNKWEEWKYASLKSLNDFDWNWNTSEAPKHKASASLDASLQLQSLNGKFEVLSSLPAGVEILEFTDFAKQNPAFIADWANRNQILDQNSLYDLNDALTTSHQVIRVKEGTKLEKPIFHQYVADVTTASAIQTKLLIYLEKDTSITWVDDLSTNSASDSILSNYVQEVWVDESAHLTFVKTQDFAQKTTHIDHTYIYQQDNSQVDMFLVPRWNTVDGITDSHIEKWGWFTDELGRINWPDYQTRIYRNKEGLVWKNKVHERLSGYNSYANLPDDDAHFCLFHNKTIDRQEKQNNFYSTI
jgi:Fe-S cluster assembly scaffold protein SufB